MPGLSYTFHYGVLASAVGLLCVVVASTKCHTTITSKQMVDYLFWVPDHRNSSGKFPKAIFFIVVFVLSFATHLCPFALCSAFSHNFPCLESALCRKYHQAISANASPAPLACTNQLSAREQHSGLPGSTQLGSRQSSHPTSGRNEYLVSRLMQSIIRYWGLMMLDQEVLKSQNQPDDIPSSPATTLSNDNTSDGGSTTSLSKLDRYSDIEEEPADVSANQGVSMDQTDPASNEGAGLTKFTLKSLLLGEELKRLQVWKTSFSNEELDMLPIIDHEVAQSVLQCLTSVASILIEGSMELRMRSEPDDLGAEGAILESLLEEIETKISENNVENEAMTDCSGISESDESYLAIGDPSLISALKYEIDRLQLLSHSLRLGMRTRVIFTDS